MRMNMSKRYYTEEEKEFLQDAIINNTATKEIIASFFEKFGRKLKDRNIYDFRKYYNLSKTDYHYNDEMLNFIREQTLSNKSVPEITRELNIYFNTSKTVYSVEAVIRYKKLRLKPKINKLSKKQINFLKKNVSNTSFQNLTDSFNETFKTNYPLQKIKSYCKSRKFYNGLHGENLKELAKQKSYPLGTERKNQGFTYVKIADDKWELKHRVIWEKYNGKIPDNCSIIFIDHNKNNFDPSNLALIRLQQASMLAKTKFSYSDKQTLETQLALADLRLAIGEAERKLKNKNKKRGK